MESKLGKKMILATKSVLTSFCTRQWYPLSVLEKSTLLVLQDIPILLVFNFLPKKSKKPTYSRKEGGNHEN